MRPRLAVVIAATALGLAACGGGHSTPHVANLGTSRATTGGAGGAGSTATTLPAGNPTQLLDEWATCMRSHGDPNQVDPTIDANNDIEITMHNVPESMSSAVHGSTGPCSNDLLAAETILRAGQAAPQGLDPVQAAKYAECMRANGEPNWPDPSSNGGTDFRGTGIDPTSPIAENAQKVCDAKFGEKYYGPNGEAPGVVRVTSFNGPGHGPPPGGAAGNGGPIQVPTSG